MHKYLTLIKRTMKQNNMKKRIAIVANESNKNSLIYWLYDNRKVLEPHHLIAAGSLAGTIAGTVNTEVETLSDPTMGGDIELISLIEAGKVDIIIFFWDPMIIRSLTSDVNALMRTAVSKNIVVAANEASADVVLESLGSKELKHEWMQKVG